MNFRSAAAAAPFALGAFTSGHTTIDPGFDARARFANAAIVFDDSDSLRVLISSQNAPLDVFLNFRAVVETTFVDVNSFYQTSVASVGFQIGSSSSGTTTRGSHFNYSGGHTFSHGAFEELPANGGEVDIAVLLRISPYRTNGLRADVDAGVDVFSVALFELENTATSFIWLSLIDGPGVLTLADGRSLSDLGVTYRFLPGQSTGSLENPILPTDVTQNPGQPLPRLNFRNVLTNQWYDPPVASGFVYTMTDGSLFTNILDFPPGFSDPFTVSVGDQYLGAYLPGERVDFVSLLGEGVSSFKISGIASLVDPEDPLAFPLKLAFNTPVASFTMQAVPEVHSWALGFFAAAAMSLVALRHRRRNA